MIPTLFLVLGIFFPRLTLLISYGTGNVPINNTPFVFDVIGAIFLPRFLIAMWAYEAHMHIGWVVAYTVIGLLEIRSVFRFRFIFTPSKYR